MTDISSELRQVLSARAEAHYPNVLPYHNWEHALDVMNVVADLADRSVLPEIAGKRNLLVVAAAWHDADYAFGDLGEYRTKEERSANLVTKLLPELPDEDRALLASGIIDTTVAKKQKDNLFGEVLHAADVGYLAATPAHFMGRLVLMRQEWGSPGWDAVVERTVRFGKTVVAEAQGLMPRILSDSDADAWISNIESNLALLQHNMDTDRLVE